MPTKPKRPEVLDLTGDPLGDDPVCTSELLEHGSPDEVRWELMWIGSRLLDDGPLFDVHRKWLGQRLLDIARGKPADDALRLKKQLKGPWRSHREKKAFLARLASLEQQGASREQALRAIGMHYLWVDSGCEDESPEESEIQRLVDRWKKALKKL